MSTDGMDLHGRRTDALRAAAASEVGVTDSSLRAAVLARVAGGAPVVEPYDALARKIGEAAYRVTDAEVDAVREAAGSDKGAFEIIMSACVGAGFARWDAAIRAIDEANDASS